jgi:hypothetical protein
MNRTFAIVGGLGAVLVCIFVFFVVRGQIPFVPGPRASSEPAFVESVAIEPDSATVNLPECQGLLDGVLGGKSGVRAVPNLTSEDSPSKSFEAMEADLGQQAGQEPAYAVLKDGRVIELKIGGTRQLNDGCQEGLVRALVPKADGMSVGGGAAFLLLGQNASAAHVKWFAAAAPTHPSGASSAPSSSRPSGSPGPSDDPLQLLHACKGLPTGAITSKELSVYEAHAPVTGKFVHLEWTPSSVARDCDGYGSLFAHLLADGTCQILQMSPYDCTLGGSLSIVTGVEGVLEFSDASAREDLLIVDVAGYESAALVSLPISKDGKVSSASCGALFVGGC